MYEALVVGTKVDDATHGPVQIEQTSLAGLADLLLSTNVSIVIEVDR
jgi:hypothetical protein